MNDAPNPSDVSQRMSAQLGAVAHAHDQQAFAEVFHYYAPRVKSFLMRQGADDALAEELAQETMLNVWRRAETYDPAKASASTWIFTIARNLRIDMLRKMKWPQFDPNDPALVPDPETPPDDALQTEEMRLKIRDAVKQLPPDQSAVIEKSFYEDKPHSEIAAELALPLGTVKSRLRLAMRRVKSLIGPPS